MADMDNIDIELGTEPIEVDRKPRAGVVISARFTADEADLIQGLAERRRVSLSQVMRDAVTNYLIHGENPFRVTTPWTGTTTSFANLTFSYPDLGPSILTEGGQVIDKELARAS